MFTKQTYYDIAKLTSRKFLSSKYELIKCLNNNMKMCIKKQYENANNMKMSITTKRNAVRKSCPIAIKIGRYQEKSIEKQKIKISEQLNDLFQNLAVTKGGIE